MKYIFKIVLVQIVLLSISSCVFSIRVVDEVIVDPGDLSNAKTYCWDDGSLGNVAPGEKNSSEFSATIRDEIDLSLAGFGYRKSVQCPADMTVALRVTIKENIAAYSSLLADSDDDVSYYGIQWRFSGEEKAVIVEKATPQEEVTFYDEGTLHVGAFDANRKLSWHVSAYKIIDKTHTSARHKEVLRKTVRAIMQKFPVN
ncbi:MAG: DUF4136 domain-containing protein [Pseudomonadales bacterium]|nr:DUF4136 domain-containing protein [Pseudomonadales bacterium]